MTTTTKETKELFDSKTMKQEILLTHLNRKAAADFLFCIN